MKPIIEVRELSKRYKLGVFNAKTLREEAEAFLARFARKGEGITEKEERAGSTLSSLHSPSAQSADFWALRDVSFDVQPGEVIGVIGRNGAGKSTLLKILSRITEPTSGEARIRGRVASVREVGTGFHPELSGRENIFLNGAILGMSKQEIRNKFDEIVAFAEIEKFIDTPVKRYSSGMYVRLAFAVAAHLEPEILIVDEVLAVGDYEFQNKCLDKMQEVSGRNGRTVLFVSHNMNAVATLTSKCILLSHGAVQSIGSTQTVIHEYLEGGQPRQAKYQADPVCGRPTITRAEVVTSEPGSVHRQGAPLSFEFDIHMPDRRVGTTFSFQIMDSMERPVVHLWRYDQEVPTLRRSGVNRLRCILPSCRLNVGQFKVRA
ncbi:MAG: ABC transporter ATP-binding protein, partial [Chthoniobacterales bacterium]